MPEDNEFYRRAGRWLVRLAAACILLYLALRHIDAVAGGIWWLVELFFPLLLGVLLALILNAAMGPVESCLRAHLKGPRAQSLRRPLALALALALAAGLFAGAALLVLPELVRAVGVVGQNVLDGLDLLAGLETRADLSRLPFGDSLLKTGIDWLGVKARLEQWAQAQSGAWMNRAMDAVRAFAGSLVDFSVGLVFALYILMSKERLERQTARLIRVWLPQPFGDALLHVAAVCGATFGRFITGQAIEALILGSLCAGGMLLLGLPYAAMIGALVGVTALIPVVGGLVGLVVGAFMLLTVSPLKALIFVLYLLLLQQLEGNLIYPKVVGARIRLPAIWVLAAVTVGGKLAGPLGMLLGVPAASSAYALLREATAAREQAQKAPPNR